MNLKQELNESADWKNEKNEMPAGDGVEQELNERVEQELNEYNGKNEIPAGMELMHVL